MKSFLKYTLAVVVGLMLTGLIFGIFIAILANSAGDETVEIKENSILLINLDKPVTDRASDNPMENFDFMSMRNNSKLGLNEILENLRKAAEDDNIKGIFLDLSSVAAGLATVEEIREGLLKFRESGKFILAYADVYDHKSYYLATAADKLYLNPQGDLNFLGFSSSVMFFKKALEKIGIDPVVIRHGKFKSAVEPFMGDKMSPENREQIMVYLGSMWKQVVKGISEQRKISPEELNRLADEMVISNAKAAFDNHLVDSLKYRDQIINELKQLTGTEEKKDLEAVSISKYTKVPRKIEEDEGLAKDKIAVIYAVGEIGMGEGSDETIGAARISREIRKVRRDEKIKAIVLRVNSPGGSALASEIIWREVDLARKVKPVIVSMGNLAASGGYYIACAADTIVANPTTLTGSIGVFGLLFNGERLLNEKIGITVENVKTNKHADLMNPFRKVETVEQAFIQKSVEDIYDTFITRVAEGRGMTKAEVDSIGQGRVWSGENAKNIKLVDIWGGLEKAIEIAAEKAKLEKYRVVAYPERKSPFEEIMKQISGDAKAFFAKQILGDEYIYYKSLEQIKNMEGVQAKMPYELEIN